MRRLALAVLLAATPFAPAAHADAVCVATGGSTACPSAVSKCAARQHIRVTVYGNGTGTVSCGGATASCFSFRAVSCSADAITTTSGTLGCATDNTAAVAVCAVVIESA